MSGGDAPAGRHDHALNNIRSARNAQARALAELRFLGTLIDPTSNQMLARAAAPLLDALEAVAQLVRAHSTSNATRRSGRVSPTVP